MARSGGAQAVGVAGEEEDDRNPVLGIAAAFVVTGGRELSARFLVGGIAKSGNQISCDRSDVPSHAANHGA